MTLTIPREFTEDSLGYYAIAEAAGRMIFDARQRDPWRKEHARPAQLPPDGDWTAWLVLAGRGFGKTRTGAEWIRDEIMAGHMKRVAFVAPTEADYRDTMVEGDSGILAVCDEYKFGAKYISSKRRVEFANGAKAILYSAEKPNRLRGPQHDGGWLDELAAWTRLEETYTNFLLGLRRGVHPRYIATTTPRPLKVIRDLVAEAKTGTDVVVTSGHTYENLANLSENFRKTVVKKYEGTRLGRQELAAEILDDVPGALWSFHLIDQHRVRYDLQTVPALDRFHRIGIGVDPQAAAPDLTGEGASETGIVCAGLVRQRDDDHAYILGDFTISGTPNEWAHRVVNVYDTFQADFVVAEANNGGEMVRSVLQTVRPNLPVYIVYASRGKLIRAEPVSSVYQQGLVHHIGLLVELEEQMTSYDGSGVSPDRLDALVWVLTKLMLQTAPGEVDVGIRRAFHGLPGRRAA